jgi:adenine-specific DNA-methyltransferase
MRHEPTPAEERMWKLLRNRRLAGFKFRRQHPWGSYILDFYCAAIELAIELDGDSHAGAEGQNADADRHRDLESCGITILRFWNFQTVEDQEAVLNRIVEMCLARAMKRER